MDSKKTKETLKMLKSCEKNLKNFSSQLDDMAESTIYSQAAEDIKRIEDRIQSLLENKSHETSEFNQIDSNANNDRRSSKLPLNTEIKSVKVVDSKDILAPRKMPEL